MNNTMLTEGMPIPPQPKPYLYQVWFHNGVKDTHLWFGSSAPNTTYENWQQIAKDAFCAIEELCELEKWQWLVGRIFTGIAREKEIPLGRIERLEMRKLLSGVR